MHSNSYRAFDSINYAPLATLGVNVDWNPSQLLQVQQHTVAPCQRVYQPLQNECQVNNNHQVSLDSPRKRLSGILVIFLPVIKDQMTRT